VLIAINRQNPKQKTRQQVAIWQLQGPLVLMVDVGFSVNVLALAAWLAIGMFLGLVYPEFRQVLSFTLRVSNSCLCCSEPNTVTVYVMCKRATLFGTEIALKMVVLVTGVAWQIRRAHPESRSASFVLQVSSVELTRSFFISSITRRQTRLTLALPR
jgi:hypothetical protein